MNLYGWQSDCLEIWSQSGYRGIVQAATGAGKTILALTAAEQLLAVLPNLRVKIIVPKTFLVRQWFYAVKDVLGIPRSDIGIFCGGHKSAVNANHRFMIYVINSARYSFSRHLLMTADPVLMIADECHHYAAEENSHIFDCITRVRGSDGSGCFYTLGLSATPFSNRFKEVLEPSLGPVIYNFNFIRAIETGIISRFTLFNISLDFSSVERMDYDELSTALSFNLKKLKRRCPQLNYGNSRGFFAALESIAKSHGDPEVRHLAQLISLLSFRRKEMIHLCASRVDCVVELVRLLDEVPSHGRPRIIIFGERIEMAETICKRLDALIHGEVGVYHSGLPNAVRKNRLRSFQDGDLRVLVSCKTLDEGLDISDLDVGIVVSSTSSERQRVQRLGRVLRKKNGKKARFYYLYVANTVEAEEVLSDISRKLRGSIETIDLHFDGKSDQFMNELYDARATTAVEKARTCSWDDEKIAELIRNLRLGIISGEWLMNEQDCRATLETASGRRERNYLASMLMMVMAAATCDPSPIRYPIFPS